jgi:hypothetical protein
LQFQIVCGDPRSHGPPDLTPGHAAAHLADIRRAML